MLTRELMARAGRLVHWVWVRSPSRQLSAYPLFSPGSYYSAHVHSCCLTSTPHAVARQPCPGQSVHSGGHGSRPKMAGAPGNNPSTVSHQLISLRREKQAGVPRSVNSQLRSLPPTYISSFTSINSLTVTWSLLWMFTGVDTVLQDDW